MEVSFSLAKVLLVFLCGDYLLIGRCLKSSLLEGAPLEFLLHGENVFLHKAEAHLLILEV